MSPSGDVITREVKPVPAAVVVSVTVLAPTSRSFGDVVVRTPLALVADVPVAAMAPSNGFVRSSPLYSAMRTSGYTAAPVKVTVTAFTPAAAAAMFFA